MPPWTLIADPASMPEWVMSQLPNCSHRGQGAGRMWAGLRLFNRSKAFRRNSGGYLLDMPTSPVPHPVDGHGRSMSHRRISFLRAGGSAPRPHRRCAGDVRRQPDALP